MFESDPRACYPAKVIDFTFKLKVKQNKVMKRNFNRILSIASLGSVQGRVASECFTSSNSAAGNVDIGATFTHKTELESNLFT